VRGNKFTNPNGLRTKLRQTHGDTCPGCGGLMIFSGGEGGLHATVDHIVPKHKGGTSEYSNLRLLCGECNNIKGSKLAIEGRVMPQRASIKDTPTGIEVQIEYNAQAVEAIKGFIDKEDRTYNSDTRTWTFKPRVKLMVQQILGNYYIINEGEVRVWPQER